MSLFSGDPIADLQILRRSVIDWTQWNAIKNTNMHTRQFFKGIENDILRRTVRYIVPEIMKTQPSYLSPSPFFVADPNITKEMIITRLLEDINRMGPNFTSTIWGWNYFNSNRIVDIYNDRALRRQQIHFHRDENSGDIRYRFQEFDMKKLDDPGDFAQFLSMITAEHMRGANRARSEAAGVVAEDV